MCLCIWTCSTWPSKMSLPFVSSFFTCLHLLGLDLFINTYFSLWAAGKKLREMIGDETIRFFVSPYKRSQQTFQHILKGMDIREGRFVYAYNFILASVYRTCCMCCVWCDRWNKPSLDKGKVVDIAPIKWCFVVCVRVWVYKRIFFCGVSAMRVRVWLHTT